MTVGFDVPFGFCFLWLKVSVVAWWRGACGGSDFWWSGGLRSLGRGRVERKFYCIYYVSLTWHYFFP